MTWKPSTTPFCAAREETERPSLILVRTHIGYGSPNKQDTFAAHGSPAGRGRGEADETEPGLAPEPPFFVPEEAVAHFRRPSTGARRPRQNGTSLAATNGIPQSWPRELRQADRRSLPAGWDADLPQFPADPKGMATRVASGKVLKPSRRTPRLVGGFGRSEPFHLTALKGLGDFQSPPAAARRPAGLRRRRLELRRPQPAFRRPGARHGRHPERHGGPWRPASRSAPPS